MCELFGFSGTEERDLTALLKEFFDHSCDHPNGWGTAELAGDTPVITTEPVAAYKSRQVPELLGRGVKSRLYMAHIRRATIGNVFKENCHPFTLRDKSGRSWTLIHNGTIFNGLELLKYKRVQRGTTDSERVLLYLIDCINALIDRSPTPPGGYERFRAVENCVASIAYRNKLNLIIYDGSQIYAHVNMKDTLYYREDESGVLIATVPLDSNLWQPLPLTTLCAFKNGRLRYRGHPHRKEYVDAIGAAMQSLDFTI